MPVILRTEREFETWVTAPPEEALTLQQSLPDGLLRVIATGQKEDGPVEHLAGLG
jgi:putative SOS response-associated peptidase YedK